MNSPSLQNLTTPHPWSQHLPSVMALSLWSVLLSESEHIHLLPITVSLNFCNETSEPELRWVLKPGTMNFGWAPAVLGFLLAVAMQRLFQPGKIWETAPQMSRECIISSVLSRHNKNLKRRMDQCYSSWMGQWVLQLSFIYKVKGNTSSRCEGMLTQKTQREERPGPILAPFFKMFFPPPGLPYVNWASQERCLFYLRSSLQSLDLPLFYLCGLFPSLPFSLGHFGLLFPILTT